MYRYMHSLGWYTRVYKVYTTGPRETMVYYVHNSIGFMIAIFKLLYNTIAACQSSRSFVVK